MTKEEILKKFREKFVRHPAEIEGTRRVEWRQLATDKVDEAEQFLSTSLQEYGDERYEEGKKTNIDNAVFKFLSVHKMSTEEIERQAKSETLKLAVEAGEGLVKENNRWKNENGRIKGQCGVCMEEEHCDHDIKTEAIKEYQKVLTQLNKKE